MVVDNILLLTLAFCVLVVGGWLYFVSQSARTTHQQIRQIAQQHTLIHADERARQLCLAVHQLHPMMHAGVDFLIKRESRDNTPYIAEWHGSSPKPTPAQLDEAFAKIAGANYADLRRAEYPSTGDQLDAAYKARRGDPEEQQRIDARIAEIKMKYPKSGGCV
jgi:hypothetical protein